MIIFVFTSNVTHGGALYHWFHSFLFSQTGLLNEIQACDDNRIKMIIQKPRDILPDSRSTRGSGHNDSYNSQALREPGKRLAVPAVRISKPDGKSSSESGDTRSHDTKSHEARSHDTRSHDVKSQRSQANNGRKPHTSGDGNVSMTSGARAVAYTRADVSVKPATAARGRSVCEDSVVTSVSGSVHVKSFQRGHRRNHSDSSSMFYTQQHQQAINQSTERGQGQGQAKSHYYKSKVRFRILFQINRIFISSAASGLQRDVIRCD